MAFASTRSLLIPPPPPPPPPSTFPFKPFSIKFPKLPFRPPKNPQSILSASSSHHRQPPPPLSSEEAILDAIATSVAADESLPAVRTYENALARLTLVGAVALHQALTAAASDGGETVDEHLSAGLSAMVVETLFPGHADDRSTVATRLFVPSRKVKEKAMKIKRMLTKDILRGTTSTDMLAMISRQVVMEHLWSFEFAIFRPGTEREMDNLENPREVPALLTLSSLDERTISEIGEVICVAALESTERHLRKDSVNRGSGGFFSWFNKQKGISSRDSSVVLHNFLECEIVANAKVLMEKFNSERGKYKLQGKLKNSWWSSTAFSKLEKIGGPEFCVWISEFVPLYRLEIDSDKLSDVKFGGWKKSGANRWEVVLTHSQMVSLADVLDMYYEDLFTLPNKKPCYAVAKPSNLDLNKSSSFWKMLSSFLVSGVFLVTISVLGKLCLPYLPIRKNFIQENRQASLSELTCVPHHSVDFSELEMCCVSIIKRIKDSFDWPGEISKKSGVCAWIGGLPKFLREVDDINSNVLDISSTSIPLAASEEEMKVLQDIASYQAVVSTDWNIIGFQPTNRVAVNNWAANPLTKVLHGGKNLSPGVLEPGLKISRPSNVIVMELLISLNPKTYFAMVKTVDVDISEKAS